MRSNTKDGKTTLSIDGAERRRINNALDVLTGGREYTQVIEKSEVAITAMKDWLKVFDVVQASPPAPATKK